MGTENIRIVVSTSGASTARRELEGIGAGASTADKALGGLKSALVAVAAGATAREVVSLADSYTTMGNRLKFATGSVKDAARVQGELFAAGLRTGAMATDLGEVYSRLTVSTKNLGLSQGEVLTMTEDLQKATQLSGATTQEAANALRQLGQGLGAGALRGDELNSILENTPLIAQLIADSMGKPIGQIRQLGSEGKITGQVIVKAMKDAHDVLTVQFGESLRTVSGSMTALENGALAVVGAINKATGATQAFADVAVSLGSELVQIAPELGEIVRILAEYDPFRDVFKDIFGTATLTDWIEGFSVFLAMLEDGVTALKLVATLGTSGGNLSATRDMMAAISRAQSDRLEAEAERASRPRVGVTIVDHPGRGRKTAPFTPVAKTTGKTFAEELGILQREGELLSMTNRQREVAKALDEARHAIHAKLTSAQALQLETQIRANQEQQRSNQLFEDRMKLEKDHAEEVARKDAAKQAQISVDLGNDVGRSMDRAAAAGGGKGFSDRGFDAESTRMLEEQRKSFQTFGEQMAHIFGPGGTLEQGMANVGSNMADLVGHAIAFGDSWDDIQKAVQNLGRTVLAELISSLIKTGAQMAINAALGRGLGAAATAASVGEAALVGAAWATPAAFASVATLGGADAAGAAGLSTAVGTAKALQIASLAGFAGGGYTGDFPANDVAGLVHGREFVVNAQATARNRQLLESINSGGPSRAGPMQVTVINQAGGVEHDVRQVDEGHIEIIARRVLAREGPDVIAQDLLSPHGRTSRALSASTTAQRRRS
jgi:tape measure domain-containing protein